MDSDSAPNPNPEAVYLRPAELGDLDRVLDFIQQYYLYDHIPFDREAIGPALETLLQDSALGTVYFIHASETLAGYLIATPGFDLEYGGRLVLVTDFFLEPSQRGRGLGTRAFDQLEALARGQGAAAVLLQVERRNMSAAALYAKRGFISQDRFPLYKRL